MASRQDPTYDLKSLIPSTFFVDPPGEVALSRWYRHSASLYREDGLPALPPGYDGSFSASYRCELVITPPGARASVHFIWDSAEPDGFRVKCGTREEFLRQIPEHEDIFHFAKTVARGKLKKVLP